MPVDRPSPSVHLSARTTAAVVISAAVLIIAIGAAMLAAPTGSGPLLFVETVSAALSGGLLALGAKLPLGYAVLAGTVASVNPCGFVLLPAYLGLYLDGDRTEAGPARRAARAITVSVTMTGSFVLLFGIVGLLAGLAASAFTVALPWIGTAVGAGLVVAGGVLASGRYVGSSLGPRVALRFRGAVLTPGMGGYAAYGAAYGLASLGCTLPVFLSVVATSFQVHGTFAAVGQLMLFGLGMGIVMTVVTITTAFVGHSVTRRIGLIGRHSAWVAAILLWLAGAYVINYWLVAIRLM